MQPIRNSVKREQIRLKNEATVKNREKQLLDQFELYKNDQKEKCDRIIASINQQRDEQIKQVEIQRKKDLKAADKSMSSVRGGGATFPIGMIISGVISAFACYVDPALGGIAFIFGSVISWVISSASNKRNAQKVEALDEQKEKLEEDAENEIQRLKDNAEAEARKARADVQETIDRETRKLKDEIRKMYGAADQQSVKELTAYDHEMNIYSYNVLGDAKKYSPIVDAIENLFQDLIAEVKNESFIKFDLKYKVTRTEVEFDCGSIQGSQQGNKNYNFFKEGFSELSKDSECEGMAKALLMLTKARISKIAPTMMMSFDHLDSEVIIHFKGVNPNGRPL